jgi:hypothetical protein
MALFLIIFRNLNLFLRYCEALVWIKSWIITAALSYYVSLIAIHVQSQANSQLHWFWEYPYHALLSSILLYLLPVLTFIAIDHAFQSLHNPRRSP